MPSYCQQVVAVLSDQGSLAWPPGFSFSSSQGTEMLLGQMPAVNISELKLDDLQALRPLPNASCLSLWSLLLLAQLLGLYAFTSCTHAAART